MPSLFGQRCGERVAVQLNGAFAPLPLENPGRALTAELFHRYACRHLIGALISSEQHRNETVESRQTAANRLTEILTEQRRLRDAMRECRQRAMGRSGVERPRHAPRAPPNPGVRPPGQQEVRDVLLKLRDLQRRACKWNGSVSSPRDRKNHSGSTTKAVKL